MQNMDQMNSEIDVLTDAELDAINGGNCVGDFFRAIGGAIADAASFIVHGFSSGPTVAWPSPTNPPRGPGQPY
jgi:hypothetical protein